MIRPLGQENLTVCRSEMDDKKDLLDDDNIPQGYGSVNNGAGSQGHRLDQNQGHDPHLGKGSRSDQGHSSENRDSVARGEESGGSKPGGLGSTPSVPIAPLAIW